MALSYHPPFDQYHAKALIEPLQALHSAMARTLSTCIAEAMLSQRREHRSSMIISLEYDKILQKER